MPRVLYIKGWRFFFYSNEGNEPIHIHIQKGEKEITLKVDNQTYHLPLLEVSQKLYQASDMERKVYKLGWIEE